MKGRALPKLLVAALVILLTLLLFSETALADFSDVQDNHWASMNIDKMSARGVITGYPDDTFQPNRTVSETEAVCMAVRALGLESSSSDTPAQYYFQVPDWAKPDIDLAVQHGLLKTTDQFSANLVANRAWVTRLLVRMIGKESEAEKGLSTPDFADTYIIPDWALYYVGVAQDYELVTGYPDNTFRPATAVTRAEMVTFLGRAEKYQLTSDLGYITGRITSAGATQITVAADDGASRTFYVASGFSVFKDGKRIDVSELSTSDYVKLLAEGSTLKYLEVVSGQTTSVISGTIKKVYPEINAVVVELASGELRPLYLAGGATISITGSGIATLDELQTGDEVNITLNAAGYASSITVNSHVGATDAGVVYDLDQEARLLTLQWDNGQLSSYMLADTVEVVAEGVRFATLSDIQNGDRVKATVENGQVTTIELVQASAHLTVTGEVLILDAARGILNLEVGGELKVYRLASTVDVTISGLTNAMLEDILEGDTVTATVNDGLVVSLEVEGRESGDMLSATIVAVDRTNRVLTLKDSAGKYLVCDVHDDARIVVNGEDDSTLGDLELEMLVNYRLLDDEIIYLEADNTVAGTVVSVDEDSLLLVLQLDSGARKTYLVDHLVDINSEDGRDELDEIEHGDYLRVSLDEDVVTDIDLRSVIAYRVTEIKESYDRLYVEDEDGDETRLTVGEGVKLIVPGVKDPDIEDVQVDDTVKATFLGSKLESVEVLPSYLGEVSSIGSNTVNLNLFEGGTAAIVFQTGSEVLAGGTTYSSISALAVGDRVQAEENVDGGSTFTVMQKVSGLLAVDAEFNSNYVYLGTTTWVPYKVDSGVYVFDSAGGKILKSSLKKGNSVDLYLLDNVVREIVKK